MSEKYRNPLPTVDIIIEIAGGAIVLIERKILRMAGLCPADSSTTVKASKLPRGAKPKKKHRWM